MTGVAMLAGDVAGQLEAARAAEATDEPRDALALGQTIHHGRYLIHGVLGRGGFATVYDGEHLGLGRRVAIKVPRLGSANPALHERFVREARTSVLVQHPNVLEIYDCGTLQDGTPFLVLERITGDSLTKIIERGPLPIALVIELGRQLARALSALAEAGIVHRDIKPDNVMLHRSKYGILLVKLVDFGVAKRSNWHPPVSLTLKGELIGTPQYMAAEQLRGEEVDGRTDIYATAAVLYEALTGKPPHNSETFSDYLVAALSAPVPPVRALRADCPASLERILLRALERDRALRQATPEELLKELDACMVELQLDGEAVRAAAHAVAAELEGLADGEGELDAGRRASPGTDSAFEFSVHRLVAFRGIWQAHLADAQALAVGLFRRGQEAGRSAVPSLPRLSLLLGLLVMGGAQPRALPADESALVAQGSGARTADSTGKRSRASSTMPRLPSAESTERVEPPQEAGLVSDIAAPVRSARKVASGLPSDLHGSPAGARISARAAAEHAPAGGRALPGAVGAPARNTAAIDPPSRVDALPAAAASELRTASAQAERELASASLLHDQAVPAGASSSDALAGALAAFVSGRLAESKARYLDVLRTEPKSPAALRGLGLAAARLGDNGIARDSLSRYLEVSPSAPDAAAIKARIASLTPSR